MIAKAAEPQSLTQHRAQAHSDYNNYPQKDGLRTALVSEQKGLCCYCTGRIRADAVAMKIEHWQCQATYPQHQLAYGNLLGACLGGHGQPAADQHCDTRKANRDLQWNPATAAHMIETRLRYLSDGTVESTDAVFNDQLNSILGLNLQHLKNNRKAVLDTVLDWWRTVQPVPKQRIQAQIDQRTNHVAEHQPFSPVAVWFLQQKLGAAAA
ncbi:MULTISPECIES: retron system putative HNH endonuclease [Mesorhizobium]|uniref:retron system putative HNH endonuclease n=1 Tax=Mesorhizobium sp. TaxID=1871066 RepID=UPI00068E7AC0|nr:MULTISPECIES: retron system putative HNH endonuclease [Mesorhizobium]RWM71191.1 MAG: TIGR02646 family protein [Mesorhizobium sp.]TIO24180.1 MAG: TIGR02646 family protein [Mesorhizobium sp.]TJV64196.1 MAG: TIGR02646 family protein [Mesorhizobium sp.]